MKAVLKSSTPAPKATSQFLLSILDQQAEGISVAGNGMRACLTLLHEAFGEERGQELGEIGSGAHEIDLRAVRSSVGRRAVTAPVRR